MASSSSSSRKGRRKRSKQHESRSLVRESSSSSSLEESASLLMPQRSKLTRQTTSEMELIEIGNRGNISMFDVLIPSSKYQGSLQSKDSASSTEDETATQEAANTGHETDVHRYMARREMTPLQERINAITVIPGAFYCFLYLLSGCRWMAGSV
eukprot:CAMPEP_0176034868 /NCGR_PEP_ID=MMETSP0120_2-20121206/17239_1 /TAXON_ID=160619 /ORGANISM="Kryptoperidinium foliaceum, Strain CCMP 1326" /LENGTH=153 /DNA_ID=CAMNT_0017368211 /DNA_START=20 /DNA_END=481 /DNA_ORIENTATION=+